MQSLYIHIPFCEKKCLYCSFVVAVGKEHRAKEYCHALFRESDMWQTKDVSTVYVGGGTPSSLSEEECRQFFETLYRTFDIEDGAEITFECNPEGLTEDKCKILFECGINRISLGIQSFDDSYLKYLGRVHDVDTAIKGYTHLRKCGFRSVNIDLMYSFPSQTHDQIKQEVRMIKSLDPDHVSLYTLTIEKNSRFFAQKMVEENSSRQAEQYELVSHLLADAGYMQYEVSNFSKPEFQSKHNMNYWCGGNYIGLGVGAHSHQDGKRQWNITRLNDYINCIKEGKSPVMGTENLSPKERFMENLLIGLRMNEGVNVKILQEKMQYLINKEKTLILENLLNEGYLQREQDIFSATDKGRLKLDDIAVRLI